MLIRLLLVFFLVILATKTWGSQRPSMSRSISYFHNTTSQYVDFVNQFVGQDFKLSQPQIVRLDADTFVIVDNEYGTLRLNVFSANWTETTRFSYGLESGVDFWAFSGPDSTLVIITTVVQGHLALKINKQGQILFNSTISDTASNTEELYASRINDELLAVVKAFSNNTRKVLMVFNNSFSLVYSKEYSSTERLNVVGDGTYLYVAVDFTGTTSLMKVHPSDWLTPIAVYNTSRVSDWSSLSIIGNTLSFIDFGPLTVTLLTRDTLSPLLTSDLNGVSEKSFPSYTTDGYFFLPSKLKQTGVWTETPLQFVNDSRQLELLDAIDLWSAQQPFLIGVLNERFYNDINDNGHIACMKDVNNATMKTEIKLMFFGDVCGDGVVSGGVEQCDGGEYCTMKCQCQSGYRPASPLSTGCVLDTTFVNCSSCSGDTLHCDSLRGACVGYRVAPIVQCVESRMFGWTRVYFSYRSNHTATIPQASTNNKMTPHGSPNEEFSLGRSMFYPLYAFYADYLAGTTVEWFLDGHSVSFEVPDLSLNSSMLCPQTASLLVETTSLPGPEATQLVSSLHSLLGQVMNMNTTFISVTIQPTSKKRQATMTLRADITNDTANGRTAAEAVRTLYNNLTVVQEQLPDIKGFTIVPLANELGEGVIAPIDPESPPVSIDAPSSQPSTSPASEVPSSSQQPASGVTSNTPVEDNSSGWSNNYIAAVVLIPLGVGAIIFSAVFFSRRHKKRRMINNKKVSLMSNTSNPTAQLNTPLTELRTDRSTMTYTDVAELAPLTSGKYGAITSIDNVNKSDRLHVPYIDLKFKKEIGAGAYGKVFIGEWQLVQVALKINTSATGDDFAREARLMVELRPHPNVVQMLGVSSDGPYPVMILEFCDGGSLDDKLFNLNEPITSQQQLEIVLGIAKGLYHLHKNQIVHRDLAARNILLNHNIPKISDFGLSRQVGEQQKGTTKSTVGPIRWMAPESLKSMSYSTKSDVWTFGIVVYEIVARHEPHSEADQMAIGLDIRDHGVTPSIPDDCDQVLKEVMTQCWRMDPEERPTMEQLCDVLVKHMDQKP